MLDPWQEDVLEAAMGERRDGKWAAQRVGLSVPRQNGKSALVVARALAGALLFGERLIVISAHQADTYRLSTWLDLTTLIDNSSALSSRIAPGGVMNALNRERVKFTNGSMIQFKARTGTGGRGFSCDCLLLDEAQIISDQTWASIYSTMSARENPQIWLTGTPPTPEDDPFAFAAQRKIALTGKSDGLAWLEWGADPSDNPALISTRRKANPAWDIRLNHEVVQGEFESYPPDRFALERLGIWPNEVFGDPLIHSREWSATAAVSPEPELTCYAVRFSVDGASVALAVGVRGEDRVHTEVVAHEPMGLGMGWLVEWLSARWHDAALVLVDGKSGASTLVDALLAAGVNGRRIVTPSTENVIAAHAGFLEAVRTKTTTHHDQEPLTKIVARATKRKVGTGGGWAWQAMDDQTDVTPLDATTWAWWAASFAKAPRTGRTSNRKAAVL